MPWVNLHVVVREAATKTKPAPVETEEKAPQRKAPTKKSESATKE